MKRPELLIKYVAVWGEPEGVMRVTHEQEDRHFWVVSFLPVGKVARVVSLGLSSSLADDGERLGVELEFALGKVELDEIGWERVGHFMLDVCAYLLRYSIRPREGTTIPETSLAPWDPDAMVFDTPRGEPDELEAFQADGVDVRLMWAVPVYADEAKLVKRDGIEALDALVEANDFSLADIRRPSLITGRWTSSA